MLKKLSELGCPKINFQIREEDDKVYNFYQKIGYVREKRISMGKSLEGNK